jgi:hypothetical protein
MKVRAYRNLTKNCWSIIDAKSGRLMFHCDEVVLQFCKLIVREPGRQRVLQEKRKNVHAFVEGFLTSKQSWRNLNGNMGIRILYNPYRMNCFQWSISQLPAKESQMCLLGEDGRLYGAPYLEAIELGYLSKPTPSLPRTF